MAVSGSLNDTKSFERAESHLAYRAALFTLTPGVDQGLLDPASDLLLDPLPRHGLAPNR